MVEFALRSGHEVQSPIFDAIAADSIPGNAIRTGDTWLDDTFDPIAIAFRREGTWLRYTILAMVRNLIAWADDEFDAACQIPCKEPRIVTNWQESCSAPTNWKMRARQSSLIFRRSSRKASAQARSKPRDTQSRSSTCNRRWCCSGRRKTSAGR